LQALVGYAPQAIVQSGLSAYTGLSGEFVLGSGVPLTVVPWFAIVEQDFSEAVGPFWWRLGVLIAGLVLVGGLVYDFVRFTRRQVVQPLTLLREGVDVVTEGNLEHTINLQTEDEFGTLAGAFNAMAAQLRQLIDTLEDRIFDRTRALETSVEISRQLTTILNLEELLQYVVNRIQTEFKFYHTHVYLVEEETGDLVMAEGSGQAGRQLKKEGHRLSAGDGIVGTVASTSQHFLSNNVEDVLNFVPNPLLPRTKSELAVPLRKGDQVLGVLDIQSEQVNRFTTSDVSLMQAIADQTAIAIDNARLVAQTQNALTQVERLNRRLTLEAWEQFGEDITTSGYRFVQQHRARVSPASDAWLPPMDQAAIKKQLVKLTHPGNGEPPRAELAIPLILRGEVIGILGAKREQASDWQEEELAAVESIANQVALALENARLAKEQEKTILHLKEVDRLKSDFLTSMSHELRTPLNSIIGFADVLLQGIDGELNEMAMNDIRLIHSSGQHLLALINDVLDLAKIEAGKMELVQVPIDVSTAVQEVLATSTSLLKNKPVELVVDVADDLPMIYADKLRFNQVFLNLVSNAAKFTDEGTITIRARLLDRFPGQLCISVTDTGVGIEPGKVDTVFDRFRQVDSSTTRKYGGSGLGLAICKQLVEMHGGEVGVESELNAGSTFYFTVPLVSSISEDESPTSVGAPN
jgi:signal transduction histidine kinase/HAMP domain-containing protein